MHLSDTHINLKIIQPVSVDFNFKSIFKRGLFIFCWTSMLSGVIGVTVCLLSPYLGTVSGDVDSIAKIKHMEYKQMGHGRERENEVKSECFKKE